MDKLFTIRSGYPKSIIGGIEIETCVDLSDFIKVDLPVLTDELEIEKNKNVGETMAIFGTKPTKVNGYTNPQTHNWQN